MTTTEPAVELTEAQRENRRQQARTAIENRLRETWASWRRPIRKPDFALAAGLAVDALGDLATEILVDGTMMRSLTVKDGVVTLELGEATEILKIFVASMRGMLDGYGAENYLETEMTAPSVSMDMQYGSNSLDSYTVTIQRRTNPTPHEFRQRAEAERDAARELLGDALLHLDRTHKALNGAHDTLGPDETCQGCILRETIRDRVSGGDH